MKQIAKDFVQNKQALFKTEVHQVPSRANNTLPKLKLKDSLKKTPRRVSEAKSSLPTPASTSQRSSFKQTSKKIEDDSKTQALEDSQRLRNYWRDKFKITNR